MTTRPSWDDYFLGLLDTLSTRGTCDRGRSSAVIVRNKRILATGYVGAPAGLAHCDEAGHLFRDVLHTDGQVKKHCVRSTHAEANAIAQSARYGIPIEGATLYCSMTPCFDCAKLMINAGIVRVVVKKDYHASADSKKYFDESGIDLVIRDNALTKYEGMGGDSAAFIKPNEGH